MGEGRLPKVRALGEDMVALPAAACVTQTGNAAADEERLLTEVFGDAADFGAQAAEAARAPLPVTEWDTAPGTFLTHIAERALLTPRNADAHDINERLLNRIPAVAGPDNGGVPERTYLSADSIVDTDPALAAQYPTEFLNQQEASGLPPHRLRLRVGAVVILLRNVRPRDGLNNGARMVVTGMQNRLLKAVLLTGPHRGREVLIPRIPLTSTEDNLPFSLRRVQFPVRLAWALTIDKAQGQTLARAGLFLQRPCFSHGQLYVAFSRVGSFERIRVLCVRGPSGKHGLLTDEEAASAGVPAGGVYTRNVVYDEVINA